MTGMYVRFFDWHDLPALHRYRTQCLSLDTALALTSGPIFAPKGAVLSSLSPATGILTFLAAEETREHAPVIGQLSHPTGQSSARLSFLAPENAMPAPLLTGIIEAMAVQVGERGGMHIIAEVDIENPLYEHLRQNGFGVYARQRIWRVEGSPAGQALPGLRRALPGPDTAAIRFLYANLVPGLVQQVESQPVNRLQGMVFYKGTELLIYIEIRYGARGIWVQPFVHPDAESVAEPLIRMLCSLPYRRARPVYICVRTYQSWLEPIIARLRAEPGPSQAVLVRHLSLARRLASQNTMVVLNGKTAEPTLPVVR